MKAASSGNKTVHFISRLALVSIAGALALTLITFAAPPLRAETPASQIKAAGAIPLTTDLLDKMDKAVKTLTADAAAKAELTAMPNDPNATPETLAAAISAKCPKAAADFKSAGIAPDEFLKAIFAIMACGMSDDMAKSSDKTAAANAAFLTANKDKCDAVFGGFMQLSMSAEPSSSPASTP
jgi:hypothetical protein